MKLILTKHANKRRIERNISFKIIKEALFFPDYKVKKEKNTEAYKKINNNLLKVVYVKSNNFIKIITLIWK